MKMIVEIIADYLTESSKLKDREFRQIICRESRQQDGPLTFQTSFALRIRNIKDMPEAFKGGEILTIYPEKAEVSPMGDLTYTCIAVYDKKTASAASKVV